MIVGAKRWCRGEYETETTFVVDLVDYRCSLCLMIDFKEFMQVPIVWIDA